MAGGNGFIHTPDMFLISYLVSLEIFFVSFIQKNMLGQL